MGRPKKSRDHQIDTGNSSHRPIESYQPATVVLSTAPSAPDWLTKEAMEYWNATLPECIAMKTIHKADAGMFGALCQLMGNYIRCQRVLRKQGNYVKHSNQTYTPRKELKEAAESLKQAKPIAEMFGLSHQSRTRMNIVVKQTTEKNATELRKEQHGF